MTCECVAWYGGHYRAEEDLLSKEREKRCVTYALLRRDEQKNLNDDIRRLKRILGRH